MRRINSLIILALFAFLVIEVVIIAPRDTSDRNSGARATSQSEARKDQTLKGIHLTETKEGRKVWELNSVEANTMNNSGDWQLAQVNAVFNGQGGSLYWLRGEKGTVRPATKDFEIHGRVVMKSSNGYFFVTDSMQFVASTNALTTKDKIFIRGPDQLKGSGVGLHATLNDNQIRILSNVEASRVLSTKKKIFVKSEWAELSGTSYKVVFHDKVSVELESARITGSLAEFFIDNATRVLQSALLTGNVHLTDKNRWALAQKVAVRFDRDEMVLTGAPKVMQNNNQLEGEEIVLKEGGKQIQVKRAKANFAEPIEDSK